MPDFTGQTLLRRYRVDEFLGRGGMAEVYRAWDATRSVHVALKVLNEDLTEDRFFLRRFAREARTLELLQHPHIVRFFGFEETRNLAFLVMEYIDGVTLRRQLKLLERPLTLPEALAVLQPVCSALHYAHSIGIYHCDVKPANIFIERGGRVVLGDFGIARMSESATMTFSTPGTPAYMAPEQFRGEDVDARTDIYSLGITTYEMLTVNRPFKGDTERTTGSRGERVRWEQLNMPPPRPRRVNQGISLSAEAAILKSLEKTPDRRQHAALEFCQQLTEAARMPAQKPLPARTDAPTVQKPKHQHRRIDAAAPSFAEVGQTIDLLVQARFPDSPPLGIKDWRRWQRRHEPPSIEQATKAVTLEFPVDRHTGKIGSSRLEIRVAAPDFRIEDSPRQMVEVPPDRHSELVVFTLIPEKEGRCEINVKVYKEDQTYLGTIPVEVETRVDRRTAAPTMQVANLFLVIAVGQDSHLGLDGTDLPKRKLENLRANLALIEERMSEYVVPTDIPLDLVKSKRRLEKEIARLEIELRRVQPRPVPAYAIEAPPASPRPITRPGDVIEYDRATHRRVSVRPWALGVLAGLCILASFALALTSVWQDWATPMATYGPTAVLTETRTAEPIVTTTVVPWLSPGDTWTRPADGMVMVYVPTGEFEMGSNEVHSDEQPVHTVVLDAFWIDRTEVTNAQYALCVSDGACDESEYADDARFNGDNYPVAGVSWYDAAAYCEWAGVRLPSEAEWEYAARGPEDYTYPWGDETPTCDRAQYGNCSGRTIPAGSLLDGASWCGALDMAGNVWEWVADWYGDYPSGRQVNPLGPYSGEYRVLRGGSWSRSPNHLRGANRLWARSDDWVINSGFRCARGSD